VAALPVVKVWKLLKPPPPVVFVNTPDVGVPNKGVTKVGLVVPAKLPVPLEPERPTLT